MVVIKEASPESLERIKTAWNSQKMELFRRNGTNPVDGSVGQDFLYNEPLRNTIDEIAQSYFPLAARKLELREIRHKIQFGNNDAADSLEEISRELEEIDYDMITLNQNAITRLGHNDSGFQQESDRYQSQDARKTAKKLLGSMFVTFVRGINSPAIMPRDGFFTPSFI